MRAAAAARELRPRAGHTCLDEGGDRVVVEALAQRRRLRATQRRVSAGIGCFVRRAGRQRAACVGARARRAAPRAARRAARLGQTSTVGDAPGAGRASRSAFPWSSPTSQAAPCCASAARRGQRVSGGAPAGVQRQPGPEATRRTSVATSTGSSALATATAGLSASTIASSEAAMASDGARLWRFEGKKLKAASPPPPRTVQHLCATRI